MDGRILTPNCRISAYCSIPTITSRCVSRSARLSEPDGLSTTNGTENKRTAGSAKHDDEQATGSETGSFAHVITCYIESAREISVQAKFAFGHGRVNARADPETAAANPNLTQDKNIGIAERTDDR